MHRHVHLLSVANFNSFKFTEAICTVSHVQLALSIESVQQQQSTGRTHTISYKPVEFPQL